MISSPSAYGGSYGVYIMDADEIIELEKSISCKLILANP